jgi:hypothetical protein
MKLFPAIMKHQDVTYDFLGSLLDIEKAVKSGQSSDDEVRLALKRLVVDYYHQSLE